MKTNRQGLLAILVLSIAIFLMTAASAQAEMATINPTADAYVDTARPTVNFGKTANIYTRYDSGNSRSAAIYLKFDLSGIPRDSTISEATVRIYLNGLIGRKSVLLGVYRATSAWDGNTITWQNKPVGPGPSTNSTISGPPGYKSFEVTNLLLGWLDGTYPDHGLFLADQSQKDFVASFFSDEAVSNRPQLVVYYKPPSTSTTGSFEGLGMATGRPPLISNVAATNIRNGDATITWATDGMTSSRVRYGPSLAYDDFLSYNNVVLQHTVTLHELQPGKTYHYRVSGRSKAGMECLSADYQFRTPAAIGKPEDTGSLRWAWLELAGLVILGIILFVGLVVVSFELLRWRRGEKLDFRFRLRG